METKIIIICGVLVVATILFGLFRLWWLRKCYDKAQSQKKDVLPSEQMVLADQQLKTYDKARSTIWKYMGIALAVFTILGTAVWGFNRLIKVSNVQKEQIEVETTSEENFSWFDYLAIYFDEDKAFRYQGQKVSFKYQQSLFEYKNCQAALEQAKAENNETEIVIQKTYLKDAQLKLKKAEVNKMDFETFPEKWRANSKLSWIILVEVICCVFFLYLKKLIHWNGWHLLGYFFSLILIVLCACIAFNIPLFTLRDVLHYIVLSVDVVFFLLIARKRQD